jgi:hypothetical protein
MGKFRPVIYVAGPYSAGCPEVFNNIRRGFQVCFKLIKAGFAPICPWLDFPMSFMGDLTIEEYYEWGLAQLSRSEGMVLLPKWEGSNGSIREKQIAEQLKFPIWKLKGYSEEDVKLLAHRISFYFNRR